MNLSRRSVRRTPCPDCGHPLGKHSGEYPGWDKRTESFDPLKRLGTGCLVEGCPCRRWFEVNGGGA